MTLLRTGLAAASALALGLSLAGCSNHVIGNGVYAERTYDPPAFARLSVGLAAQATVTCGAPARSVKLSGDENLLDEDVVKLEVIDATLTLSSTHTVTSSNPLKLTVALPDVACLAWAEAIEGSQVRVASLGGEAATAFGLHAADGSHVELAGAPPAGSSLTADLATGASLDATGYPVASAALTLASHAEALVACSGPVTGTASGGSLVTVSGGGSCGLTLFDTSTCAAP